MENTTWREKGGDRAGGHATSGVVVEGTADQGPGRRKKTNKSDVENAAIKIRNQVY